jgi:hypothetical protein
LATINPMLENRIKAVMTVIELNSGIVDDAVGVDGAVDVGVLVKGGIVAVGVGENVGVVLGVGVGVKVGDGEGVGVGVIVGDVMGVFEDGSGGSHLKQG